MFKYSHVLIADFRAISFFLFGSVLLLGGFVACIALAAFAAQMILLHPASAFDSFFSVMSWSEIGLFVPVRCVITCIDWVGLCGVMYFVSRDLFLYTDSLSGREKPATQMIYLPVRFEARTNQTDAALRGAVHIQLLDEHNDVANW